MAGVAIIVVKKLKKNKTQQPQQGHGNQIAYAGAGAAAGMAAGAYMGGGGAPPGGPSVDQVRQVLQKCVQDVSARVPSFPRCECVDESDEDLESLSCQDGFRLHIQRRVVCQNALKGAVPYLPSILVQLVQCGDLCCAALS